MSEATRLSAARNLARDLLATVPGRPIAFVLVFTILGAIAGVAAGGILGVYTPSYFQMVFRGFGQEWFSPVQIGLSLGFLQGGGVGLATGAGLVIVTAWWRTGIREASEEWPFPTQTLASRWLPALALTLIVAIFVGAVAFTAGIVIGQRSLYQVQAEAQLQAVREWIDGQPEYADLFMRANPDGRIGISGLVPDAEAEEKLQTQLNEMFGIEQASTMLRGLNTLEAPED